MTARTTNGWVQAIFTLIFIVVPALLLWVFLSNDLTIPLVNLSRGIIVTIAFSFIIYAFLITLFFIWLDLVWFDLFNFTLPVSIALMGVFVTYELPTWARALIVLALVLLAFPINILTNKYISKRSAKK